VRDDSSQTLSLRWFFFFFFVSGFCSILYELIWLRLAMAQFGVTSALVSIVLSMFMAGLGAGIMGKWCATTGTSSNLQASSSVCGLSASLMATQPHSRAFPLAQL
jgi:predicted membrane-bound spermidine synthase